MNSRLAAVIIAGLCLTAGTGAGATAAAQITGADIKDATLTTADVKDKSLSPADFSGQVSGLRGPAGTKGVAGAAAESAGYSWAFDASANQVPAMSTGTTITLACPAGSTVLGGSGFWTTPLEILDSQKVLGQETWTMTLAQPSGNSTVFVNMYVWCAGLDAPVVLP